MTSAALALDISSPETIDVGIDSVRELVKARIRDDNAFGHALLAEAIEVMLSGDMATARNVLFDYIDATMGFAELSLQSDIPKALLLVMFGPAGDPQAAEMFRVIGLLQQHQGIRLQVSAA